MKKPICILLAVMLAGSSLLVTGCGHEHTFTAKKAEEQYLCTEATCSAAATYYYSCTDCGEKSEKTFENGLKKAHDYSAEVVAAQYLLSSANCMEGATYYKSCTWCGKKGTSKTTFMTEGLGSHDYSHEVATAEFLKEEATFTSGPVYYKSCVCGDKGEETFVSGEPLKVYQPAEKFPFKPSTVTLTLYDTERSLYGITYQTESKPLRPVVQIAKGDSLSNDYEEYACTTEVAYSSNANGGSFSYYVSKVEVPMDDLSTYTYRIYDKYVDVGTIPVTIETKDLQAESFSFAHLSDSQASNVGGTYFGEVLGALYGNVDFLLHTGDIVESSLYAEDWTEMIHNNATYLTKMPMMALAGNHDSIYQAGDNELYEHFHYPLVNNQNTDAGKGQYYSFAYGNAKFIMLNSNKDSGSKIDDAQLAWLIEELENNDATWTIVAIHQPMYSAGRYGSLPNLNSQSLSLRAQLSGIFAQYGVDLVLQGHDHLVSRTYPINATCAPTTETWKTEGDVKYSVDPSGVIYLMNGAVSDQARGPVDEADASLYAYKENAKVRSFAKITITGNRLVVVPQYVNGTATPYGGNAAAWGIEKSA